MEARIRKLGNRWVWVVILSAIPAGILWWRPQDFNPFTSYLLSLILMAIPLALDRDKKEAEIEARARLAQASALRAAEERWLPQAESATDRLMTIRSEGAVLKASLSCGCAGASQQLPKLDPDTERQVLMLFDAHCRACIGPVTSVINHLDSAIGDWRRFIQHSCHDGQCAEIFAYLDGRQQALDTQARVIKVKNSIASDGCSELLSTPVGKK